MQSVTNVEQLLRAPIGRYLAGRWYLVWVYHPSLIGTVYFGVPDEQDFAPLERLFTLLAHPALAARYDVLVDCSAVGTVPLAGFEFLGRYLMVAAQSAPRMRRVAIVRPRGMFGATLAGVFYETIRERFFAGLFADRAEASGWLANAAAADACAELDRLVDDIRGTPGELRRLSGWLDAHLTRPELGHAARDLGLSARSLQRRLAQADTSFRAQVERARMRAAERLLLDGAAKLEVVARTIGYSRLGHFATAFRRVTGETPGQFRSRRQPPATASHSTSSTERRHD